MGSAPSGSAGDLPITANFVNKSQKMNVKTIAIIALSAFVVLLVFIGALSIFFKWRKVGRPSNAVGPVFTPSINKRSGEFVDPDLLVITKIFLQVLFDYELSIP